MFQPSKGVIIRLTENYKFLKIQIYISCTFKNFQFSIGLMMTPTEGQNMLPEIPY
jgi:hypothetical protein